MKEKLKEIEKYAEENSVPIIEKKFNRIYYEIY